MNTDCVVDESGQPLKGRWLLVLLVFFAVNMALADEADDGQILLHAFVDEMQSMSARFEQSLIDANGDVLETSSGTVDIRRPGRFRWAYAEPYEQLLVADGLNVWSYDVDLAQVTVKPQADVLSNTPALLLGGSDNVLSDFDYLGSFEDRGTVWVRLRPKKSDRGFSKVELGFTDGTLSRMMFDDTLEQTTLIALLDVTTNERKDDNFFEFVMPDDVDLVGRPILAEPVSAADR
ncbi:MAG: outer membrane lipoprotein chaperone LolA [Gammaproteobacteria bacterium]|nr:outer membrane lipoprotein chaperone LolA [Gammaproteobacteria bacterium]